MTQYAYQQVPCVMKEGREGTVLDFRKLLSNDVAVHTQLHRGTELLRLMLSSKSPVTKIFMFHPHYLALTPALDSQIEPCSCSKDWSLLQ